jgi:MFS family permease
MRKKHGPQAFPCCSIAQRMLLTQGAPADTRYELQKRYSILYAIGSAAGCGAGILAFGLMQLKGQAGLDGWNWIFIMEGIISSLIGIASYWLLIDFPDKALESWRPVSEAERDFMIARVHADRADELVLSFSYKRFLSPALDWKIWCFALLNFCTSTTA